MKHLISLACALMLCLSTYAIPSHSIQQMPKGNVYDYDIIDFNTRFYAEEGNFLQVNMTDEDYTYTFHFVFENMTELQPGTYTLDDMGGDPKSDYNYGKYLNGPIYVEYAEATLTYSVDSTGRRFASAIIVSDEGDTYNLHYSDRVIPDVYNDVDITMTYVKLIDYTKNESLFQFQAANDTADCFLALQSRTIPGEYDINDLYFGYGLYNYLYVNDVLIEICDFSATITAGSKAGEYNCLAHFYCYDGNCYNVTMNYEVPEIVDTTTIVCTNMDFRPYMYAGSVFGFELNASNNDYSIYIMMYVSAGTVDGITLKDSEGRVIDLHSDELTVRSPIKASGWALTYDGHYYILDLSLSLPEPTRTLELDIDAQYFDAIDTDNFFQLVGNDPTGTYYVSIECYSYNITGHFNEDYMEPAFSYIGILDETGEYLYGKFRILSLSLDMVDNHDGTYSATADILSQREEDPTDYPRFILNMPNMTDYNGTALDQLSGDSQADVSKQIKDGRLLIIRNGRTYDALGQLIH
ncbi:MAG: hypothetical protein MJZ82_00925 [Paludibacteraceae bacterium]|nr:hypothetical protein [Paludibacteraceae bacterium]